MDSELKKLLKGIDIPLLVAIFTLCIISMVVIASATKTLDNPMKYLIIQAIAIVIGFVFMFFIMAMDYESLGQRVRLIYIISIIILILVLIIGIGKKEVGGNSWLRFGILGFQPSEIAKLGIILTFAKHLERIKENINNLRVLGSAFIHVLIPIFLVLLQPDYGTAMVYIFVFVVMVFAAGLYYRYYLAALAVFTGLAPIIWNFILKPFQRDRIMVFLNPEHDPSNSGYQVIQSKIAIGSGQFPGIGLFHGTQTQLDYIPEKHTDFVFAVVGEELGFIGAFVVIALLFFIIMRCIHIARNAKSDYGVFVCVGIAAIILFQAFENVGMCIGLMPVTGIPLPFISYGGSSMLTNLIAIGIVMNVWIRRKTINF